MQAPAAVTQAPGTCCGAERGGEPGLLPHPVTSCGLGQAGGCRFPARGCSHVSGQAGASASRVAAAPPEAVLPRCGHLWVPHREGDGVSTKGARPAVALLPFYQRETFSLFTQQLLPGLTRIGVCL